MSAEPHASLPFAIRQALSAPRCGARCRRNGGAPCRGPAIKGMGRCRMHGGRSTGPSVEGRQKLAALRWKHGHRSRELIKARSDAVGMEKSQSQLVNADGQE